MEVFVLGAAKPEDVQRVADTFQLPYVVLADPDRSVYRAYGLRKVVGVLQRSGTVLVDRHGIVRYDHRVSNPDKSMNKAALVQAVDQVAHQPAAS